MLILQESQSAVAIAVAAHDLGEYVRYYPRGKRYGTKRIVQFCDMGVLIRVYFFMCSCVCVCTTGTWMRWGPRRW